MDLKSVPQDNVRLQGGHLRTVYARDEQGHIVAATSTGWEVEEIVNQQALEALHALQEDARKRVNAGSTAPLEYWMYAKRMDLPLLAQSSGYWQWQVRRHLRPQIFAKLNTRALQRYADALGIDVEQMKTLP